MNKSGLKAEESAVQITKQSLLWSGLLGVMLLMLTVPLLNFLALLCIMFPVAILAATHSLRNTLSLVVATLAVVFIIYSAFGENYLQLAALSFMPLGWLPIASLPFRFTLIGVMFVVPALVLGYRYQQIDAEGDALRVCGIALGVYVGLMTALLGVISWVSGTSVLTVIGDQYKFIALEANGTSGLYPAEQWGALVSNVVYSMQVQAPLLVVLSGVFFVGLTHLISGKILRKQGFSVPRLQPLKNFRLPAKWMPYMCIVLLICLFFSSPNYFYFLCDSIIRPLLSIPSIFKYP
jgi:uncharacterized protein YybS (DUF2232 family)